MCAFLHEILEPRKRGFLAYIMHVADPRNLSRDPLIHESLQNEPFWEARENVLFIKG